MNNITIIKNNYGRLQYRVFSSKFPWARERISSKFVDNLGTRHQKMFASPAVYTMYTSSPVQVLYSRSCLIYPGIFLQRQLDIWAAVRLIRPQVEPLIFPMLGFALSNVANIFIVMIS